MYKPEFVVGERFPYIYQLQPGDYKHVIKPVYQDGNSIGDYIIKPFIGFDARQAKRSQLCLGINLYDPKTKYWFGGRSCKIVSWLALAIRKDYEATLKQYIIALYRAMWLLAYLEKINCASSSDMAFALRYADPNNNLVYAWSCVLSRIEWDKLDREHFAFIGDKAHYDSILNLAPPVDSFMAMLNDKMDYFIIESNDKHYLVDLESQKLSWAKI